MWSTIIEFLLLLLLIHFWIIHRLSYWKRVGVCSVKGKYLLGNMKKFWKRHISDAVTESYQKLKHKDVIGGFYYFLRPMLLVFDPQLIDCILTKDSEYFSSAIDDDPMFTNNLQAPEGHPQKELRAKITPTFELKLISDTMVEVGTVFGQHVGQVTRNGKPIDVSELCNRFAIDILANCGLGVLSNSFQEPENKFRKMLVKVSHQSMSRAKLFCVEAFPEISRALGIRSDNVDPVLSKFVEEIITEKVKQRNNDNDDAANKRNDMINTLLKISRMGQRTAKKKEEKDVEVRKLAIQEISTQIISLFAGQGYEATAASMTWCLYEMAKSAVHQDKLADEVRGVMKRYESRVSYEAIQEMTYLDQVVSETFRLHPVVHILRRMTTSEYRVPESTHIVTKGTLLLVPIHGIHSDPAFYPKPEEFDPERFTATEVGKRPAFTFLSGEVVGMPFTVLQIKVGLVLLLAKYRFSVSSKTKEPIKLNPKSTLRVPQSRIWLNVRERE